MFPPIIVLLLPDITPNTGTRISAFLIPPIIILLLPDTKPAATPLPIKVLVLPVIK